MFKQPLHFPFATGLPLVMACHFTDIYDVNRSIILPNDQFSLVSNWAQSLQAHQVNGIIFHNNFSDATCLQYQHPNLSFIQVNYDKSFKPNVYRYIVYREFLRLYAAKMSSVFLTDVSDVVMVNNPFIDPFFTSNTGTLFCGDEPIPLENEWMFHHSLHLRTKIANFSSFEAAFRQATLLNCGIIGGNISIINNFINQLADIHVQYNCNNTTPYTGDMGAFNYLARSYFNDCLVHGYPVNTVFKAYENLRQDCWFRHK